MAINIRNFVAIGGLAIALIPRAAHGGQITLGATCESWACLPGSYVSASFMGAAGFGPIDFVDSYKFPVNNGSISFDSTSATSGGCTGFPPICTLGFGAGGNFQVTGSVFGLPAGSMLIEGTFLTGGRGVGEPYGSSFKSNFEATYINPAILVNLGFPAGFITGQGTLMSYDSGGFPWSATLEVTPAATPEASAAELLLVGLIFLGACGDLKLGSRIRHS